MPLTREQIITDLTTNCDCWRGAKDVLNSMTDDRLLKIKSQHDGAAKATIIVNAAHKSGLVLNGEKLVANEACPECGGAMTEGVCDDCGYKTEAAAPAAEKKKTPLIAENQSRLTKEEREDLAYAKKMRVQNKQGLIRRIVANSSAATKEHQTALVRNLNAKDEGTLETILACQPQRQQVNNEDQEDTSWFFGSGGGAPVHNRRQDADDIAVLEQDAQDMMPVTLNYEEMVTENRKHAV
jgi:predicted  nucleic acid-binding Zn-ribbon protein